MSTSKMLIDATHPEETRVVVLRNNRVEEFDYESAARKLLRGNIYLAKVTRVEPSLQAAFVEYGGNRHGFLAFGEIHPDYYQIPLADRQALLDAEAEDEAEEERQADERAEARARRRSDAGGNGRGRHRRGDGSGPDHQGRAGAGSDEYGEENGHTDAAAADMAEAGAIDVSDLLPPEHAGEHTSDEAEPAGPSPAEPAMGFDAGGHPVGSDASQDAPETRAATTAADPVLTERAAHDASGDDAPHMETDDPTLDEVTTIEGGGLIEMAGAEAPADAETVSTGAGEEDTFEEVPIRRQRRRPRAYKIQEVIKKRQIILVQVVKEERGTKGAALTTYLSLAGRYTVLMPNTGRGGGISRKITNAVDRKRLKAIAEELEVPEGMGLIIRTAGASRTKQEIKRDFEYLLRLWESVRELTLKSVAPSLVYEEGDLIKRSIRDLYTKDVEEIVVAGDAAFKDARDFMRMLMPSHAKHVVRHEDPTPVFVKYQIERQLNAMFSPYVHLRSGGYLVINQTEALVAIDINSGKSTREFSIEETALNTNLEAADEIARQLKLRDLAGLIVVDFIDMEEKRNNRLVERRMKDALRHDRARIQVGRISHFGLLEMSRQRMRTGVLEGSTTQCPHCQGTGIVRSVESISLAVLRGLEDAIMAGARTPLVATTTALVALYLLNNKRAFINEMEARVGMPITIAASDKLVGANFTIERGEVTPDMRKVANRTAVNMDWGFEAEGLETGADDEEPPPSQHEGSLIEVDTDGGESEGTEAVERDGDGEGRGQGRDERGGRRRRRRSRGGDRERNGMHPRGPRPDFDQAEADPERRDPYPATRFGGDDAAGGEDPSPLEGAEDVDGTEPGEGTGDAHADGRNGGRRGRRRGRRGGRRGRARERVAGDGMPNVRGAGDDGPDFNPDSGVAATDRWRDDLGAQPTIDDSIPLSRDGGDEEPSHPGRHPDEDRPDRHQPEKAEPLATANHPPHAVMEESVATRADREHPAHRGVETADLPLATATAEPAAKTVAIAAPEMPAEPVAAPQSAETAAPADSSRRARIEPVASEPVVASLVIGSGAQASTDAPKPVRRGWWSRTTST